MTQQKYTIYAHASGNEKDPMRPCASAYRVYDADGNFLYGDNVYQKGDPLSSVHMQTLQRIRDAFFQLENPSHADVLVCSNQAHMYPMIGDYVSKNKKAVTKGQDKCYKSRTYASVNGGLDDIVQFIISKGIRVSFKKVDEHSDSRFSALKQSVKSEYVSNKKKD